MLPPAGAAPLAAVPENRTEALAAAQVMQERARVLRRISAEHLRHLARPFFAAGWSPRDLLHAIDHEPGGRQHGYTAGVRSPAGWIPSRLAAWFGPNGVPLPSRSQRLTEARRQVLADQAARRAQDAAAHAPRPRTTRRRPPGRARCSGPGRTQFSGPDIEDYLCHARTLEVMVPAARSGAPLAGGHQTNAQGQRFVTAQAPAPVWAQADRQRGRGQSHHPDFQWRNCPRPEHSTRQRLQA